MRLVLSALAAVAAATAMAAAPLAAAHAEEVIACETVDASQMPIVMGFTCMTIKRGPVTQLRIIDAATRSVYSCRTGQAGGVLWVRGEDCEKTSGS
ncbi:hypothetical protein [Nonomuraea sp. WAC 01424]|uniref:hypothetical protein n=1 Tax=Nonomuraea sp. WAC 01424 TaxID=2203200 RepID=UPI000F76B67B|nr:hypothetical protein [Nonomuraea sp. WAC 01424]